MKKALLVIAAICLWISGFAQQSGTTMKYDRMLYQMLTEEQIAKFEAEAPAKLADINFTLTHFCYVDSQLPANTLILNDICTYVSPGHTCNPADIVAGKKLNRYHYALPTDDTRYTAFPVGNSGFYVIALPNQEFVKQRNEYMKKFGN